MFSARTFAAAVTLLTLIVGTEAAHVPAAKVNSVRGQDKGANDIHDKSSSSVRSLFTREALVCCVLQHTVVTGDTCDSVAASQNIAISVIESLNSANCTDSDEANLVVGGQLCLAGFPTSPACTKQQSVVSGDSCSSIAQANLLTLAQLQDLNPFLGNDGTTCPTIFPDEVLCVAGTPQLCPGTAPTSSSTGTMTAMSSSTTTGVVAATKTSCTSSTTQPVLPPFRLAF